MTSQMRRYYGYRFPPEIIGHAIWLYRSERAVSGFPSDWGAFGQWSRRCHQFATRWKRMDGVQSQHSRGALPVFAAEAIHSSSRGPAVTKCTPLT
jgi:hypothetical protein